MSTLAKIEREKISERTKAGVRRAQAEGKKVGRPAFQENLKVAVRKLIRQGCGIRETARKLKVSTPFVYSVIKRQKKGCQNSAIRSRRKGGLRLNVRKRNVL